MDLRSGAAADHAAPRAVVREGEKNPRFTPFFFTLFSLSTITIETLIYKREQKQQLLFCFKLYRFCYKTEKKEREKTALFSRFFFFHLLNIHDALLHLRRVPQQPLVVLPRRPLQRLGLLIPLLRVPPRRGGDAQPRLPRPERVEQIRGVARRGADGLDGARGG